MRSLVNPYETIAISETWVSFKNVTEEARRVYALENSIPKAFHNILLDRGIQIRVYLFQVVMILPITIIFLFN